MTRNAALPLAFGAAGKFGLDHPDQDATGLVEGSGQLENGAERWLLLAEFEDADVGTAQIGLKANLYQVIMGGLDFRRSGCQR